MEGRITITDGLPKVMWKCVVGCKVNKSVLDQLIERKLMETDNVWRRKHYVVNESNSKLINVSELNGDGGREGMLILMSKNDI